MPKGVKAVKVECNDGSKFEVPHYVVKQSKRLKNAIRDVKQQGKPHVEIAFTDIDSATFSKVMEWCAHHKRDPPFFEHATDSRNSDVSIPSWDLQFLGDDQVAIYRLVMAADKLEIGSLLNLCCKRIALLLKGKSVEEIRNIFNIESDFTPEEEDQLAREEHWLSD